VKEGPGRGRTLRLGGLRRGALLPTRRLLGRLVEEHAPLLGDLPRDVRKPHVVVARGALDSAGGLCLGEPEGLHEHALGALDKFSVLERLLGTLHL
jgi:hypothetical protein